MTMTRRALLMGAGGTALVLAAGCDRHHDPHPVPVPDRALLEAAVRQERELLYRFGPQYAGRSAHETHLRALLVLLGTPSPTITPPVPVLSPSEPPAPLLRASVTGLQDSAVAAVDGSSAATLASIAAAHAVEVFRSGASG